MSKTDRKTVRGTVLFFIFSLYTHWYDPLTVRLLVLGIKLFAYIKFYYTRSLKSFSRSTMIKEWGGGSGGSASCDEDYES